MNLKSHNASRSRSLAIIVLTVMALFVVRLFYLQIIKHNDYLALADQEQLKTFTIPAKRGMIYALDGKTPTALVMNETVYTAFIDPQTVTAPDKVVEVFRRVAGGNMRSNIEDLTKSASRYEVVATKLSRVQAEIIKEEGIKGVAFKEVSQRVYPEGQLAAQTLGFVNGDGIGQYGVEAQLEDRLNGKDGTLQTVTDVSYIPLTIGDKNIKTPAKDGENIVLSIDRNIQSYAEKALAAGLERTGATNGSVIIMNPTNGQVMAMSNLPTFNPANYSQVEDISSFNNAIVSVPYEPGSDVKTLTMAMGIDKGVVSPEATFYNTDSISIGGWEISNAVLGHTGMISFQTALSYSLNTGFVTVAERLGDGSNITLAARKIMYDYYYNKFKLGQVTGIEVSGEVPGTVISPDEVEGNAVRYSNMSFGQGMDNTMIQVASAFCAIVDGGQYHKPTVVAGVLDENGNFKANQTSTFETAISQTAADQVREMTHVARSLSLGNSDKPGYEIGGKTGTSQTLVDGNYDNDQTVGTYLGYGGDSAPKYVIMVQVSGKDRALQGARDAGPIFTDISNWIIDYMKLQPKG